MYTHQANRYTQFITPLGGIIALACFFMPWVRSDYKAFNLSSIRSGFQFFVPDPGVLHPHAISTPVVFIASVLIVGLSLYMVIRRAPWKLRMPILISGGIGLAILFAEQLRYARLTESDNHSIYSIKLGFWGTVAGLVIAVIGILLVRGEKESRDSKGSVAERTTLVCRTRWWDLLRFSASSCLGRDLGC